MTRPKLQIPNEFSPLQTTAPSVEQLTEPVACGERDAAVPVAAAPVDAAKPVANADAEDEEPFGKGADDEDGKSTLDDDGAAKAAEEEKAAALEETAWRRTGFGAAATMADAPRRAARENFILSFVVLLVGLCVTIVVLARLYLLL